MRTIDRERFFIDAIVLAAIFQVTLLEGVMVMGMFGVMK